MRTLLGCGKGSLRSRICRVRCVRSYPVGGWGYRSRRWWFPCSKAFGADGRGFRGANHRRDYQWCCC